MAKLEVELPDRIESDIEQLIAQDEFVNWDEAVEKLLARGVSAYGPAKEQQEETGGDLFNQSVADQQDPALDDTPQDDYGF